MSNSNFIRCQTERHLKKRPLYSTFHFLMHLLIFLDTLMITFYFIYFSLYPLHTVFLGLTSTVWMPLQLSECRVISIHLSYFYISCMCWGFTENMSIMQMNVTFAFSVFLFEWSTQRKWTKKVKENLPSIITYIALLGDAFWRSKKKLKLMITSNGCLKIKNSTMSTTYFEYQYN